MTFFRNYNFHNLFGHPFEKISYLFDTFFLLQLFSMNKINTKFSKNNHKYLSVSLIPPYLISLYFFHLCLDFEVSHYSIGKILNMYSKQFAMLTNLKTSIFPKIAYLKVIGKLEITLMIVQLA